MQLELFKPRPKNFWAWKPEIGKPASINACLAMRKDSPKYEYCYGLNGIVRKIGDTDIEIEVRSVLRYVDRVVFIVPIRNVVRTASPDMTFDD